MGRGSLCRASSSSDFSSVPSVVQPALSTGIPNAARNAAGRPQEQRSALTLVSGVGKGRRGLETAVRGGQKEDLLSSYAVHMALSSPVLDGSVYTGNRAYQSKDSRQHSLQKRHASPVRNCHLQSSRSDAVCSWVPSRPRSRFFFYAASALSQHLPVSSPKRAIVRTNERGDVLGSQLPRT